jgi:hypothetical protein
MITLMGYLLTQFATTVALGKTLLTALTAVSRSWCPPSQLADFLPNDDDDETTSRTARVFGEKVEASIAICKH